MFRVKTPIASARQDSSGAPLATTRRLVVVDYPGPISREPGRAGLDEVTDWASHQPHICRGTCYIVSQADTLTLGCFPHHLTTSFPTDTPHPLDTANGSTSDFELIREVQAYLRCRSGGSVPGARRCRAWERFYSRCSPIVHRIVANWRMPIHDTDDCVQEVWGEIIEKLPSFNCDPRLGGFQGWLSLVVRRKTIHFNRRKAGKRFNNIDDVEMPLISREPDPADACLSREKRRHVRQMLSALGKTQSESSYQVLYHRSINDLNVKGIANLLDLTPEQVRARYHRMKQKARQFLRSQFDQGSYSG